MVEGRGARPVRGPVMMRLDAPFGTRISLRVFDVQGRLVRALVDGRLERDDPVVGWDLRDAGARRVAPGVYFARLESPGSPAKVEKLHVVR